MKNKKALSLLLYTNVISGFAQGISMLSIPWYFTTILHKESLFGIVYMVITLAMVFWSLYAGTLVDRYPRKNIFLGINMAGCIILLAVSASGFIFGEVPIPLVMLVFATTISIYNIHYPCLYAFGHEISEKSNYGKINSYFEIQGQATTMLAGAIGAILISGTQNNSIELLGIQLHLPFNIVKWELHHIFLMDAITYFMAIFLIFLINYTPIENYIVHTGRIWDRMKTGLTYLKENPLLFLFGNMTFSIFVVLLVAVHLLLPWYVSNHLEKSGDVYASAEIYYTIGALMAGFGIRSFFKNTNSVKAIISLMILTSIVFIICAFTKNVWVFFAFSGIIGVTNAGTRVLRVTFLFNKIPNNVMGRTGGVFQVINIILRAIFIGLFSFPFFSEGSNVTWAYLIGGLFVLVSAIPLMVKYKSLSDLTK